MPVSNLSARRNRTRYYFGRLNIIAGYENKRDFLLDMLSNSAGADTALYNWNFFDITELTFEEEQFFTGYLVKYRFELTAERANLQARRIEDAQLDNLLIAKAPFFLHVKTGLIAFHPDRTHIKTRTFVNQFKAAFEANRLLVQADIQMIEERQRVWERLTAFESVSRITISLHPSNPNSAREWKDIDDEMHQLRLSNYQEHFHSKDPEGMNTARLEEDTDLRAKIIMAEDGYGRAEVKGKMNGTEKVVSSQDNPITTLVESGEQEPRSILGQLWDTFKDTIKRNPEP